MTRSRLAAALAAAVVSLAAPALAQTDEPEQKTRFGFKPKAADGDAPLPVGFPDGTRPGVIEVKKYPAYRSAVARGEGMSLGSGDSLFMTLFRHIDRNGIAMTAPVVNTYKGEDLIDKPGARGEVSMEFLYRQPEDGKLGPDGDSVEVVDHPPGQFVCIGVQGSMSERQMRESVVKLREWLEENKAEWVEDGPPRRLGYHGPMTLPMRRLWEVQIPVKPAKAESQPETETDRP